MEIYLDHAATTRIAPDVLAAMHGYEMEGRGNPFRGLYSAAERATDAYERAREEIAHFFGASSETFVFTKGATEGLNMVAAGLLDVLQPGDEIILSLLEHHAHLLPWRDVALRRGCVLRFVPLTRTGEFDMEAYTNMLSEKTKVVAVTHVSNVLGSIVPVRDVALLAQKYGAFVCVDGAQAVGHFSVSVEDLAVDAYAMSAHKMYGPMGIGGVYLSHRLQEVLQPLLLGGGMIEEVALDGCPIFSQGVRRFEAGTPNVTGAIGFSVACRVLRDAFADIVAHERELTCFLWEGLNSLSRVHVFGPAPSSSRSGVLSFSLEGFHPHDVAQFLSDRGIAVRAGFHCAAPLARCLHRDGVVRVSLGRATTKEECSVFLGALRELLDIFS